MRARTHEGESRKSKGEDETAAAEVDDTAPSVDEQLTTELARIRARFAVDPVVVGRTLAPVYIGAVPEIEEDEAEFRDAMADCEGAGLPLETALACWHTGDLAVVPEDDADEDAEKDEDAARVSFEADQPERMSAPGAGHRRLLVR